jgi:hypothetical protein
VRNGRRKKSNGQKRRQEELEDDVGSPCSLTKSDDTDFIQEVEG